MSVTISGDAIGGNFTISRLSAGSGRQTDPRPYAFFLLRSVLRSGRGLALAGRSEIQTARAQFEKNLKKRARVGIAVEPQPAAVNAVPCEAQHRPIANTFLGHSIRRESECVKLAKGKRHSTYYRFQSLNERVRTVVYCS